MSSKRMMFYLCYICNTLAIAKPIAKNRKPAKTCTDYDGPWPMMLTGATDDLRKYLLWHQTFAVSHTIAFNAIPFDKSLRSWVIMNITGDAVSADDEMKRKALGIIKETMWKEINFWAYATRVLTVVGVTKSVDEMVYMVTKSFDMHLIESKDDKGNNTSIWQLMGKPLAKDMDEHRRFLQTIRNPTKTYLTERLHQLLIKKRFVNCVWCKAETHPGWVCPFFSVMDWQGPLRPMKEPSTHLNSADQGPN
ncbi:hypothetical protein CPB84DRAFT_1748276 [Gymnopilus junonius]|uniref:Uncharacterized protein n=1 Tax=Gymnopilus junonius TaxID=109634 RepID=A0A9P5NMA3_GYMJU|nr:hypothetical protein CPB84DRAFT_1748276 [Gymnopilus junonius]